MNTLILFLGFFSALLFACVIVIRFDTLCGWKESIFKVLQGAADRPIRFFFLAAFLWFVLLALRVHAGFRLSPIWHKTILFLVCVYTFVFFNPQQAVSTANAKEPVYCPDKMAYSVMGGHYIRCEDFDEFHAELHKGVLRKDLYLK